jgi:hypothetical protein
LHQKENKNFGKSRSLWIFKRFTQTFKVIMSTFNHHLCTPSRKILFDPLEILQNGGGIA